MFLKNAAESSASHIWHCGKLGLLNHVTVQLLAGAGCVLTAVFLGLSPQCWRQCGRPSFWLPTCWNAARRPHQQTHSRISAWACTRFCSSLEAEMPMLLIITIFHYMRSLAAHFSGVWLTWIQSHSLNQRLNYKLRFILTRIASSTLLCI